MLKRLKTPVYSSVVISGLNFSRTSIARDNDGLADSNIAAVTITVPAVEHKLYLPLVLR